MRQQQCEDAASDCLITRGGRAVGVAVAVGSGTSALAPIVVVGRQRDGAVAAQSTGTGPQQGEIPLLITQLWLVSGIAWARPQPFKIFAPSSYPKRLFDR